MLFEIRPETNLLTVVPTRGMVRIEWALMFSQIVPPTNMTSATKVVVDREVTEARNIAVQTALEHEVEFLFFLDDDTFCGPQTPRRFHNLMRQSPDFDILTGIVPMKTPDREPCIYRKDTPGAFWDWTFGEVFEIDACGMACCMIRTELFKQVSEPWFTWESGHQNGSYEEMGEDVGFCRKAKDVGAKIMADGMTICGHMDVEEPRIYEMQDDALPFVKGKDMLAQIARANA